jgi:hypothetical protein
VPLLVGILYKTIKILDESVDQYNDGIMEKEDFDRIWDSSAKNIIDNIQKFSNDHHLNLDKDCIEAIRSSIMNCAGKNFEIFVHRILYSLKWKCNN